MMAMTTMVVKVVWKFHSSSSNNKQQQQRFWILYFTLNRTDQTDKSIYLAQCFVFLPCRALSLSARRAHPSAASSRSWQRSLQHSSAPPPLQAPSTEPVSRVYVHMHVCESRWVVYVHMHVCESVGVRVKYVSVLSMCQCVFLIQLNSCSNNSLPFITINYFATSSGKNMESFRK